MENIRFFLYVAAIGGVFLVLTAIKLISPEKEYKAPVDEIGMRLYRPIFFGENGEGQKKQASKPKVMPVVDEEASVKISTEEPVMVAEKPVKRSASEDETFFLEMIREYNANVLSENKYRNDVVIRYYKHGPDDDRADVLVDYGFYLHVRPVNKNRYEITSSNVLYYGHEFPERDLKLIAYLLVKNGLPIKRLQPFKNYDGWKNESLEIGGNPKLNDQPTLTFSQIREYSARQ